MNSNDFHYFSKNGEDYVVQRSYGLSPNGNPLSGQWAIYNTETGELVDHDWYINDLKARYGFDT